MPWMLVEMSSSGTPIMFSTLSAAAGSWQRQNILMRNAHKRCRVSRLMNTHPAIRQRWWRETEQRSKWRWQQRGPGHSVHLWCHSCSAGSVSWNLESSHQTVDQYGPRDLQVGVPWRWKLGNPKIYRKGFLFNTLFVLHGIINCKTDISGTPAGLGIPTGQWIGCLLPVLQQLFLEVGDRRKHGFVLDFGRWNDDATVHEVSQSICELTGSLCLEGNLIEDLEQRWQTSYLGCGSSLKSF